MGMGRRWSTWPWLTITLILRCQVIQSWSQPHLSTPNPTSESTITDDGDEESYLGRFTIRPTSKRPASGSQTVGESCAQNTDCVSGGFCESGRCKCWSTHMAIGQFCWQKINPEQSGCSHSEQCDAVWPGARCLENVCRCPEGHVVSPTREGAVCHLPGHCPTNGANSLLHNRNSNTPSQCFYLDGDELPRAGRFMGCDDFSETYDCLQGLCCPTRALTCIQSMDVGSGGRTGSTKRWFYNSILGNCQTFDFLGHGGNSNHFLTKQQCESYCINRCRRGQPQLSPSQSEGDNLASLVVGCASWESNDDECNEEHFQCEKSQSTSTCCPSPAFICSEMGGLGRERASSPHSINISSPILGYSTGSNRLGQASVIRWYWDRVTRRCRTFRYLGQGGNFNNFLTEQHCIEFCSRSLCPVGLPLSVSSSLKAQQCSTNAQCPRSHQCTASICCPTPATICNQPLAMGALCSAQSVYRYWFNAAQGACEAFEYHGCQGNSNNFFTLEECQSFCGKVEETPECSYGEALRLDSGKFWRCQEKTHGNKQCPVNYECITVGKISGCCPTREFTCQMPSATGKTCGASGSSLRWYFDEKMGSCKTFNYHGCDGNANNFANQRECEDVCQIAVCPNGGEILTVNKRNQPLECDKENNNNNVCPSTHRCTQLYHTGMRKTGNFCCPSKLTICTRPIDTGLNCSSSSINRFAFNPLTDDCEPFEFNGCAGNANNFPTRTACLSFCRSAACGTNEIIYETNGRTPFNCSIRSCPIGFQCVADVIGRDNGNGRFVCCGMKKDNGQYKKEYQRSQRPQTCTANQPHSCPIGFFCIFNADHNKFFCCSNSAKPVQCPAGARTLRNPVTMDTVGCNWDSQCSDGSKCFTVSEYQTGICCSAKNACPPLFQLDNDRLSEAECSPLVPSSCDANYQSVCVFSDSLHRFVCCRRESKPPSTLTKCPKHTVQDQLKHSCSPEDDCPSPFVCLRQKNDHVGICCKPLTETSSTVKLNCPKGMSVLMNKLTATPQRCSDSLLCPSPYQCNQATTSTRPTKICCLPITVPGVELKHCESGTVPLSTDGIVQNCTNSTCPNGYHCESAACCPMKELSCKEAFFAGAHCSAQAPIQRFYYDSAKFDCRSFIYAGCNPNANHFLRKEDCEKMCRRPEKPGNGTGTIGCPPPFVNPIGKPQICSPFFDSCPGDYKCMPTSNKLYFCCAPPAVSSLKALMRQMCGSGWKPANAAGMVGEPVRCDAKRNACPKGQKCKFSSVLLIDICCMTDIGNGKSNGTIKPLPPSRPVNLSPDLRRQMEKSTCPPNLLAVATIGLNSTTCLPKLNPGRFGCLRGEQCLGNSLCVNRFCRCPSKAVQFNGACYLRCPMGKRQINGNCI